MVNIKKIFKITSSFLISTFTFSIINSVFNVNTTHVLAASTSITTSNSNSSSVNINPNEFYSEDNPKEYSLNPVMPDLTQLEDNTDPNLENQREFFLKYATRSYPKYSWNIINIVKMKDSDGEYISCEAYSNESLDVHMTIEDRNGTITDSFKRDVVGRLNTMNRWKKSFSEILNPITLEIYPLEEVRSEIVYHYINENVGKIKLDQPFDKDGKDYKKVLEIIFSEETKDPKEISEKSATLLKKINENNFNIDEYYIRVYSVDEGKKEVLVNWFIVPSALILDEKLKGEIEKAISNQENKENLVKPSNKNGILIRKLD